MNLAKCSAIAFCILSLPFACHALAQTTSTATAKATPKSISVTGYGNKSAKKMQGDVITLDISGTGNIDVDEVIAKTLKITVSGAGDVTVKAGTATALDIVLSGTGTVRVDGLKATNAKVQAEGAGDVFLHADATLNATAAGTASIRYRGQPAVTKSVSGTGSVEAQ